MRKLLGPLLLAALALISLLYMQHQRNPTTGAAPTVATATTESTSSTPLTPTRSPAQPTPTSTTSSSLPAPAAPDPADGEGTSIASATPAAPAQATQWTAAAGLAVNFLKAYARPPAGTPARSWWAAVKPLLTIQAAADYAGTDPANVPFSAVTGPPAVWPLEAPDTLVTAVQVPTDAGPYLVEIRTTPDGLRVARATPQGRR